MTNGSIDRSQSERDGLMARITRARCCVAHADWAEKHGAKPQLVADLRRSAKAVLKELHAELDQLPKNGEAQK